MKKTKKTPQAGDHYVAAMARVVPGGLYEYAVAADGSGRFLYLSERAGEILELPVADLLADMSLFWDLVHPKDIPLFRDSHAHAEREENPGEVEVRLLTPAGKTKWLRFSSLQQGESTSGALIRSGFMADVTQQKALASKASELEAMKRKMKALEASNTSLHKSVEEKTWLLKKLSLTAKTSGMGALIGALAHEVGQPLQAIHLATFRGLDMLESRRDEVLADPERLVAVLNNIDRYQSRIVGLIAAVRQLFRRGAKDFEPINLSEVIGDVLAISERGLVEEKIALQTDIEPDVSVIGDIGQLQLVLLNLMNNACNALREANAKRRISVHLKREGRQAVIDISDNGPGLPPGGEDQLFNLLDGKRSEETGIGLWLCREILTNHGGCLFARNRPGGGAKFTLELPA